MEKETINKYMREALNMALGVKGTTSPNPSVGAIILKDGKVIGRGVTQKTGSDHAEVQAIKDCGGANLEGATMIVTFEPCCHYGRTPPCVEAIKKHKMKEVYIAVLDPNQQVSGKGVEILRKAGIKAEYGFLEDEARKVNEDFFKWINTGKPFVTVKYAMTLDGKMATANHSSKWITSEESRKDAHLYRFRSDAVMVGSHTIKCDNPRLNSRLTGKEKYPLRIIVDSNGYVNEEHTVIKDEHPTLIVIPPQDDLLAYYEKLIKSRKNKAILPIKMDNNSVDIEELFNHLGTFQITSIMVEGGARALYSCYKYGVIDKIVTYIAPKILSGDDGLIPFAGVGPKSMNDATELKHVEYQQVGEDIKVVGYMK